MSRPPGAARDRRRGSPASRAVVVLCYIALNTLGTDAPGSKGLQEGERLPPFAVPLATAPGPDDTDANVATRPGQGNAHHRACDVRGPGVLNSCELAERGPVALAFFADRRQALRAPGRRARPARAALPGRLVRRHRDQGEARAGRRRRAPARAGACRSASTTTRR